MANNKQTTKLIARAYKLLDTLNGIKTGRPYRDMIYDLACSGERRHRRGTFATDGYLLTVYTAAQLFTVRWLVIYATKAERMPTVASLLELRPDAQLAAMVAANYRKEILDALEGSVDLDSILAINYTTMVKGEAE